MNNEPIFVQPKPGPHATTASEIVDITPDQDVTIPIPCSNGQFAFKAQLVDDIVALTVMAKSADPAAASDGEYGENVWFYHGDPNAGDAASGYIITSSAVFHGTNNVSQAIYTVKLGAIVYTEFNGQWQDYCMANHSNDGRITNRLASFILTGDRNNNGIPDIQVTESTSLLTTPTN